MGQLTYLIFVAHGSIPGQIHVSDESLWYVYREIWEGRALLDTRIHGSFVELPEAEKRRDEVRSEYT